jgi:4-hydroxybenzoate polyprenyltransferase
MSPAPPSRDASPAPARPALTWRERIDAYERLLRLDKPIGTLLLLWPTLTALWIAAFGAPPVTLVLVFVMGTWLMRSAGCAINDWADRDYDGHVKRTAARPLARGTIAPWEALVLAALLALAAFALVLSTTRAAVLWSFPALAIAIAYPFFKRFFAVPQAFLGIAFSFGIPMAYAAVYNGVPPFAWALLGINLLWVMAYDTEYAMVDRDDDLRLGLRTSAITFGRFDVAIVALCYALYLAGMAWAGWRVRLGWVYDAGLVVAAGIAAYHVWLIRGRGREACFRAFLHNHWLGLAVFVATALDYAVRLKAWPRML